MRCYQIPFLPASLGSDTDRGAAVEAGVRTRLARGHALNDDCGEQVRVILSGYKRERRWLIPILEEAQRKLGYVPEEAVRLIAEHVHLSESEVFGVVTFYAFFRTTPTGKKQVMVCSGTACHVRGGRRVLQAIQRELGIKEGETAADLSYSLETVACIGACALAPNMTINDEVHGRLTPQKALEILRADKEEAV